MLCLYCHLAGHYLWRRYPGPLESQAIANFPVAISRLPTFQRHLYTGLCTESGDKSMDSESFGVNWRDMAGHHRLATTSELSH